MILARNNMIFHSDDGKPYIYVFENYDHFSLNENIIKFINSSSSYIKFVFISRNRVNKLKNINTIEIPPFTNTEIHKLIQKRFHFKENLYNIDNLQQKITKVSKRNPLFVNLIIEYISSNDLLNIDSLKTIYKPCILDQYGKPIEKIDNSTQIIVTEINDELLYEISKKPELLHNLSSYEFECVIAKIFEKQGFSVEITPKTRDGGKDIFIAKQGLASFLFYVECKKYAPNKPVGIDIIQRLYGVISAEKANGGFIATTSHFTKPAENYIKEYNLAMLIDVQDYAL